MTDFLSREKEFQKMNSELNQKTKTALEQTPKYSTFTKKVPIILNKGNDRLKIVNRAPPKNAQREVEAPSPRPPPGANNQNWPAKFSTVPRNVKECTGHVKKVAERTERLQKKPVDAGKPCPSRRATVMVTEKYKNKNFSESPSFDELQMKEPLAEILNAGDHVRDTARREKQDVKLPKKTLSSDGLIKFLKSKVTILQDELEANCHELSRKVDELKASFDRQKKLEHQRDQAFAKNNQLMEQLSKLEEKFETTEKRLKEREAEYNATTKLFEVAKRDLKISSQAKVSLEKRLYQANEELENLKNTMSGLKDGERELKDATKAEKDALEKQIKVLKKQRSDALNAYKKQLFLVDNLRRQNICMEQARMIAFGEKEFSKVLDWSSKNS